MMADSFPKFREKLTPATWGFSRAASRIFSQVRSFDPSLTKTSSQEIFSGASTAESLSTARKMFSSSL